MNAQQFEAKVRWAQDALERLRNRMNEAVEDLPIRSGCSGAAKEQISKFALAVDLIQQELKTTIRTVDQARQMSVNPEREHPAVEGLDVGPEAGVVE